MKTKNYYRLTKKELSFLSSIDEPCYSSTGELLTRPVVLKINSFTREVVSVFSLTFFKYNVKKRLFRY